MERFDESHSESKPSPWYRRALWLAAIWFGSVAALGVVASLIRLLMHLAGMKSH